VGAAGIITSFGNLKLADELNEFINFQPLKFVNACMAQLAERYNLSNKNPPSD
jgi:hypothetical protein